MNELMDGIKKMGFDAEMAENLYEIVRITRATAIEECISAIRDHYGFSDDEKRIATAVLHALQPSFGVGSPASRDVEVGK